MSDTMLPRLTPEETALMTAYTVHQYEVEKGKEVTRFRLSRDSVRRLSFRANLRDAFLEEWTEAMASDWDWIAFPNGEEFGLVRRPIVASWVRIATKRLADDRRKLKRGDRSVLARMRAELAKQQSDDERPEEETD